MEVTVATNVTNASAVPVSTLKPFTTTEVVYQRFAIEPMDQTAVIGSRVTLPCRVLDQKGPIQWTKDDFGLGAVRNLTGYERYAMIGSDEEGERRLRRRRGKLIFTLKLLHYAPSPPLQSHAIGIITNRGMARDRVAGNRVRS
jgi:hypothetical protein